jgi:hypothetical protein
LVVVGVVVDVDVDVDVVELVGVVVVVLVGVDGVETRFVGLETAMLVPFLLLAVTATRMVKPASVVASKSVCAVAPFTVVQASPLFEQWSQ